MTARDHARGPVQPAGEPVAEQDGRVEQIWANYRPAPGAARCETCAFWRGSGCMEVKGPVRAEDVCDLWEAATDGRFPGPA